MKLLTYKRNNWSCLPTAMAMVLDTNVDNVIQFFGHDGSRVLWPHLPDPKCRQGFQPSEMVQVGNIYFGVLFTPVIPVWPALSVDGGEPVDIPVLPIWVHNMFLKHDGVLIGKQGHAVAWSKEKNLIFDPNGSKYRRELFPFETFWMASKEGTW